MLPVLLMQFLYKAIWLAAVAFPQWDSVGSAELTTPMLFGIIVDVIVIPWPYVFKAYVRAPGEPWGRGSSDGPVG